MAKEKRDKSKKDKSDKKRKRGSTALEDELETSAAVVQAVAGSTSSVSDEEISSPVSKLKDGKKRKLLHGITEKVNGQLEDDFNKNILLQGSKPLDDYQSQLDRRLIENLTGRGITSLFEIQVKTLPDILSGHDVIGRARTGMGKTLAFTLPVIQQMITFDNSSGVSRGKKLPRVLVLAPTRELAKQVSQEFEETSAGLYKVLTVYGGVSINDQSRELYQGVDVVVGTPGRVLDHLERGNLQLSNVRHFILDEADQMLDMGFKDEMDKVFDNLKQNTKAIDGRSKGFQVLLFSATLAPWVKDVAKTKMEKPELIDLVGDMESASKDVEHLCIQCGWQNEVRAPLIMDLVRMYAGSKLGRVIVFCNTKKECNDLAEEKKLMKVSKVIHGDVTQQQREATLHGFRHNTFKVLIATDVAARGLDIKNVDLVINCEPPTTGGFNRNTNSRQPPRADVDTYVHRSGRTGRAGKKGVCVTLFTAKQLNLIQVIEQETTNTLKRVGAPQTEDLILGACRAQTEDLLHIEEKVWSRFTPFAEEMLEEYGAKRIISACLAKLTGFDEASAIRDKSLLNSEPGYVTVKYENMMKAPGEVNLSYVWGALRNVLSNKDWVEQVKGMQPLKSELGAVFDLPQEAAEELQQKIDDGEKGVDNFEICTELPETKQKEVFNSGSAPSSGGRGGSRGGRGGSGFRGRGGARGRGGRGRF